MSDYQVTNYRESVEKAKEGEWIIHKGHWEECYGTNVMVASQIECPCCHHKEAKTTYKWNYCPNCGAKMKEKERIKE